MGYGRRLSLSGPMHGRLLGLCLELAAHLLDLEVCSELQPAGSSRFGDLLRLLGCGCRLACGLLGLTCARFGGLKLSSQSLGVRRVLCCLQSLFRLVDFAASHLAALNRLHLDHRGCLGSCLGLSYGHRLSLSGPQSRRLLSL